MPAKRRPLRGPKLDTALDAELGLMLEEGLEQSPINISTVAKRLGLGSRNTLSRHDRKATIYAAAKKQRVLLGNKADKATRDSLAQLDRLKGEKAQLLKDLNNLRVKLVLVAINAHKLGYSPEKLLQSLREQKCAEDQAEPVWERYLRKIRLLDQLDPNVRKFVV
ncbi:MAG: hypothetical protein H8K09_04000 [Nitrospira sp.]|nr:hypothetical protein [Nitrospira sp.]